MNKETKIEEEITTKEFIVGVFICAIVVVILCIGAYIAIDQYNYYTCTHRHSYFPKFCK